MRNASASNREYRHRFPEKAYAHATVHEHIRTKRLVRQPCERCGEAKTHAHHEDYSKPLEVVWLCQPCHVERHKELATADPEKWGQYTRHQRPEKKLRKPQSGKRRNYTPKPRKPSKKSLLKEHAQQLRNDGRSYSEIATALGVSKGNVFKWLNSVTYK